MRADPSVDAAMIVADQETPAIDRLDQMQVHAPAYAHQDDVADLQVVRSTQRDRDPRPIPHFRAHRLTVRVNLHSLAALQGSDLVWCCIHDSSLYPRSV